MELYGPQSRKSILFSYLQKKIVDSCPRRISLTEVLFLMKQTQFLAHRSVICLLAPVSTDSQPTVPGQKLMSDLEHARSLTPEPALPHDPDLPVTAEALVPSSLTSIFAFCKM